MHSGIVPGDRLKELNLFVLTLIGLKNRILGEQSAFQNNMDSVMQFI